MIEKLLDQSALKNGHQISFILNHRVLAKSGLDWTEVKGDVLTIDEWEDLKELCLQGNEKVQLETKGYIVGILETPKYKWKFSFTEKKDCFRAHLSLIKAKEEVQSHIENPLFWEAIKKDHGIFIVGGERRQGKTSLMQEIVSSEQKSKLRLVGVHSAVRSSDWDQLESAVQLGTETIDFDATHPLYEGVERVVVDLNSVKNWKKWIEMAEQGQSVLLSLSINSVRTVFNKFVSDLDVNTNMRLFNVLNGVVVQKLVGSQYYPCSEILVIKQNQKDLLRQHLTSNSYFKLNFMDEFKDSYQSLNQSLVQKLIRRKIDVQSAFEAADDPDSLDQMLKKMGL
ncbi:MAG: pilT, twitching motility protein PilT [Pseudobdellovibrio sp.]|jgi:twitching motility protein PilT|nr:pilT, twitching motility protein PilT [Pseudobdellovibrio sp.]